MLPGQRVDAEGPIAGRCPVQASLCAGVCGGDAAASSSSGSARCRRAALILLVQRPQPTRHRLNRMCDSMSVGAHGRRPQQTFTVLQHLCHDCLMRRSTTQYCQPSLLLEPYLPPPVLTRHRVSRPMSTWLWAGWPACISGAARVWGRRDGCSPAVGAGSEAICPVAARLRWEPLASTPSRSVAVRSESS